jgi:hypothetical protein
MGKSTTTPTRAAHPNHVWSDDFVQDEATDGRRLKGLTVQGEDPREGLPSPVLGRSRPLMSSTSCSGYLLTMVLQAT